jgi:hypothetical protein
MDTDTIKAKIKAIIPRLEVGEYNQQVKVEDVCRLAEITYDELCEVIMSSMVSYGLYNISAPVADVE